MDHERISQVNYLFLIKSQWPSFGYLKLPIYFSQSMALMRISQALYLSLLMLFHQLALIHQNDLPQAYVSPESSI